MEPPPAPTVCTSTLGSRIGRPAIVRTRERSADPSVIRQTSVDVPPMSNAMAFAKPARSATRAAPTTPPAGPDRRAQEACAAASTSEATPPDERITSGSGSRASAQRRPSASR
jgi:hypothetical protein